MQMIKPSYKILDIPNGKDSKEVSKFIEKIGRTCYKSEGNTTDDSCVGFVGRLWTRRHTAMLEHYIFTLAIPEVIYNDLVSPKWHTIDFVNTAKAMQYIQFTEWENAPMLTMKHIVSGSLTAFFNILKAMTEDQYYGVSGIYHICKFLQENYPECLTMETGTVMDSILPHVQGSVAAQNDIILIPREEVKKLPPVLRLVHDWYTFQFTVDRGVTHELVRHHDASWAQESTRYCNYTKDKYGNEITVIIPTFFDTGMGAASNSLVFDTWKHATDLAESDYMKLIHEYGATPQQARTVLNNSTKADIIMTARIHELRHFFNMRAATDAHPQMREVAVPLLKEMVERDPAMFKKVYENLHLED